MALLSWNNTMTPPLPFILSPPQPQSTFEFGNDHPTINVADGTGQKSRDLLKEHHEHAKEDTAQGLLKPRLSTDLSCSSLL